MDCTMGVITIKWPSGRICLKTCFANPRLVWLHEAPTTSFVGGYNLYQTVQTMDVCLEYVQGLEQIAPNRNSCCKSPCCQVFIGTFDMDRSPPEVEQLSSRPTHLKKGANLQKKKLRGFETIVLETEMWESYVMTADQLQKVRMAAASKTSLLGP